jgi:hypothetical protein
VDDSSSSSSGEGNSQLVLTRQEKVVVKFESFLNSGDFFY